jgi:hypothetical protein
MARNHRRRRGRSSIHHRRWAMPVTITPSTRAKVLRVTARDPHPPLHDPFKTLTEMLTSAAVLRPSSGRFWDSDSDSECEDHGDAEAFHPTVSSSPVPPQRPPAGVASSAPVLPSTRCPETPPRRSPATQPRRAKPPRKSLWKGPLPRARISPPATLGDYLPPVLQSAGGRGAAGANDAALGPVQTVVQFLESRNQLITIHAHQQADPYPNRCLASGPDRLHLRFLTFRRC